MLLCCNVCVAVGWSCRLNSTWMGNSDWLGESMTIGLERDTATRIGLKKMQKKKKKKQHICIFYKTRNHEHWESARRWGDLLIWVTYMWGNKSSTRLNEINFQVHTYYGCRNVRKNSVKSLSHSETNWVLADSVGRRRPDGVSRVTTCRTIEIVEVGVSHVPLRRPFDLCRSNRLLCAETVSEIWAAPFNSAQFYNHLHQCALVLVTTSQQILRRREKQNERLRKIIA